MKVRELRVTRVLDDGGKYKIQFASDGSRFFDEPNPELFETVVDIVAIDGATSLDVDGTVTLGEREDSQPFEIDIDTFESDGFLTNVNAGETIAKITPEEK